MIVVIIYSRDDPVRSAVHYQLHDAKMKSSVLPSEAMVEEYLDRFIELTRK